MARWEYLHIRFDYKGRGITQEFNLLDINGKREINRFNRDALNKPLPATLPELLQDLGEQEWEMVSHVVNQDNKNNNVTFHYMNFKRPMNE